MIRSNSNNTNLLMNQGLQHNRRVSGDLQKGAVAGGDLS